MTSRKEMVVQALSEMNATEIRDVLEEAYTRQHYAVDTSIAAELDDRSSKIFALDETVTNILQLERGEFISQVQRCPTLHNSLQLSSLVAWDAVFASAAFTLSLQLAELNADLTQVSRALRSLDLATLLPLPEGS